MQVQPVGFMVHRLHAVGLQDTMFFGEVFLGKGRLAVVGVGEGFAEEFGLPVAGGGHTDGILVVMLGRGLGGWGEGVVVVEVGAYDERHGLGSCLRLICGRDCEV